MSNITEVLFGNQHVVSQSEKDIFGKHWCGPDRFNHGTGTLVAKYVPDKESDGYQVNVYCMTLPVRTYSLIVLGDVNEQSGVPVVKYKIETGGEHGDKMTKIVAGLAEYISGGMLEFASYE